MKRSFGYLVWDRQNAFEARYHLPSDLESPIIVSTPFLDEESFVQIPSTAQNHQVHP